MRGPVEIADRAEDFFDVVVEERIIGPRDRRGGLWVDVAESIVAVAFGGMAHIARNVKKL